MGTTVWIAVAFLLGFIAGMIFQSYRYARAFIRLQQLQRIQDEADRVAAHMMSSDDPAEALRTLNPKKP